MSSKQFGKSGGERSARHCVLCDNNAVENHGCPVKMTAASLSKRIYSLINHSGNGMNSLFTTNHFILKKKKSVLVIVCNKYVKSEERFDRSMCQQSIWV